jgi:hypothetical protein
MADPGRPLSEQDAPEPSEHPHEIACAALESGKCLKITYRDFVRVIEVHRVGISPKGCHILSGWRILGPVCERVGWKIINLDEPIQLTLTAIPSQAPRPDYRPGAKLFIGIICQL